MTWTGCQKLPKELDRYLPGNGASPKMDCSRTRVVRTRGVRSRRALTFQAPAVSESYQGCAVPLFDDRYLPCSTPFWEILIQNVDAVRTSIVTLTILSATIWSMALGRLGLALWVLILVGTAVSGQTKIALDERLWVASKIYASIPIYFAHWQGARDLDLDAAYRDYLKAVVTADTRWEFDHLTLEFMARLKNGHTAFADRFLNSAGGPPIGFRAVPVEGAWTVIEAYGDKLKIGDVIERIDKLPMNQFFAEKRKYISASSEAAAQRVFFFHKHLFPQQFRVRLATGADVSIDRSSQQLHFPEVPFTE